MRVLLDTNIVLDFVLRRAKFLQEAEEIFLRLQNLDFEGFVTSVTVVNTFYTTRKEIDAQRASQSVSELLMLVGVCSTEWSELHSALSLNFSDYEDAVQCASAVAEGLDAIVTRNTKDFENSPITVYSPAEFLRMIEVANESNNG